MKIIILLTVLGMLGTSCATLTPEELSKVQTKEWINSCEEVNKASIRRFIESGYKIESNDVDTGYLSASKKIAQEAWASALAGHRGGELQANMTFSGESTACTTKLILTNLQSFKDGFGSSTSGGIVKEAKEYIKIYAEIESKLK